MLPILEGSSPVANKTLHTEVISGDVDALFIDLRNVDGAATPAQIAAFMDAAEVKVTFFDGRGRSRVVVDDVNLGFFKALAELSGGFTADLDGAIVPLTRYNLSGAEKIDVRISWVSYDVAPLGAADVQVYRLYTDEEKADGVHTVYASTVHAGGIEKYQPMVPNLAALYYRGSTLNSVTVHLNGRAHEIDVNLAQTLTRYQTHAPADSDLVLIYSASVLGAFDGQTVQVQVDATDGELVQLGSSPDAQRIRSTRRVAVARAAGRVRSMQENNADTADAVVSMGIVRDVETLQAEAVQLDASKPAKFKPATSL